MRVPPLVISLTGLLWLGGCSRPDADAGNANDIDLAAAASRGQSDIANYAAGGSTGGARSRPEAVAASVIRPAATPPKAQAQAQTQAQPADVVRRYLDARRRGDDAGAEAEWDADPNAEHALAAQLGKVAPYQAVVGTPSRIDSGAGQRYVTVPVSVTGHSASGTPVAVDAKLVLHRAADGIESDDPRAHDWRIRSGEITTAPQASPTATR